MFTLSRLHVISSLTRQILSLVILLPFTFASQVKAAQPYGAQAALRSSHKERLLSNQPPVAVDDSGSGYITDESTAFTTVDVLANDTDADGDIIFVQSINSSGTAGQITWIDGSLDRSLDGDGLATTDFCGDQTGNALVLQPDGEIVVAGSACGDFAMARLNPDGSLDTSFNGTGKVTTDFGNDDVAKGVALQPDSKIVMAGSSGGDFALARYNPDGNLDNSFGTGGKVVTNFTAESSTGNGLALQADGKILVVGSVCPANGDRPCEFAIARYDPSGNLDSSFGEDGKVITYGGDSWSVGANALTLQPDGKILVAGGVINETGWQSFGLFRYNPDGSLDTSFDEDGKVTTPIIGGGVAYATILQPDGRIIVAGGFIYTPGFTIARYNPNGSLDTSFSGDGMDTTKLHNSGFCSALALQPDGKIIMGGRAINNGMWDFAMVRHNPDGSMDKSFDFDGKLTNDFGDNDEIRAITIQPDGKIVAAGLVRTGGINNFAIARYSGDGSFNYNPDSKFDWLASGEQAFDTFTYIASDGVLTDTATVTITVIGTYPPKAVDDSGTDFMTDKNSPFTTGNVLANDTDLDSRTIYVGGVITSGAIGIVSPLAIGSLDPSFGIGGKVTTDFGGYDFGQAVVLQPDGKIVVAGSLGDNFGLARYNPDGQLDTSFDGDGKVITDFGGSGDFYPPVGLARQADGKLVLVGQDSCNFAIARYNLDGSMDLSFDSDGIAKVRIDDCTHGNGVVIQTDGKIIVVGQAWIYGPPQMNIYAVARLNPNGSLDTGFGTGGKVTTTFDGNNCANSVILQPDGKLIVVGTAGIVRYNSDGSLDASFGSGGKSSPGFSLDSVVYQPDGKIVVEGLAGDWQLWGVDFGLARYNSNGSLDKSFGNDGIVITDFGGNEVGKSIVLQSDGKIVLAGGYGCGACRGFALVRYNRDGSLDTSFNSSGLVTTDFSGTNLGYAVAVQPDGKIVVAGRDGDNFAVARYNIGGTYTYNPDGQFDWLGPGQQAFDTFTYIASDGILTNTATVTITINGLADLYLPVIQR